MAELQEYIPTLSGVDIEIFEDYMNRELTEDEIASVKTWAGK